MPPDPPSVLAPLALDTIFAGLTINCFHRSCYFKWGIVSIILRILLTQKDVSFLSRKGCTFRIMQRYIMLKILDIFKINALQTAKFMFSNYHQNLPSVFSN